MKKMRISHDLIVNDAEMVASSEDEKVEKVQK